MDTFKLQAFWVLALAVLLVVCAAGYIAYTGRRLRKHNSHHRLKVHKDAVWFLFPLSVVIALVAVRNLVKVSGGRFSPLWLYSVHMFVVAWLGVWYFTTMYNNGLKDPIKHVKLAHQTGVLFVVVAAFGVWVGSFNPIARAIWAALW